MKNKSHVFIYRYLLFMLAALIFSISEQSIKVYPHGCIKYNNLSPLFID